MRDRHNQDKYILAIDHGTSGAKTALVSVRGEIIDFEFEPTPLYHLPGGGVEQDPREWWSAIINTSRKLIEKQLVDIDDIVAVCCSSTFSSTVVVDRDGEPLMNSMTWMDSRGAPLVKKMMEGRFNVEGYAISNILAWVPKAGGAPALSGKDDIGHMLYVQHERPEIYRKAHMFFDSKDYLNLRFTGKFAATFDSITLFWVTDNRDIHNIHYDNRLIDKLKIDREKLPPLMKSTEVLGPVLDEVADEIGLRRGTKFVAGSPDLQSACVGSGAVRDYEGHIYIGTSSWMLCHVPFKKTDIFHIIASLPSSIPGRYFCANEQDLAGGCINFLIDNLLYHKGEFSDGVPPEDIYQRLDKTAAAVPAGSGGLIFTPWLNGEKTPVENHTLRGGFHNMSLTSNTDHMVRAVFEGVAFNSRWVMQYVEKFIGRQLEPLNIIGGGALSDVWCQIYADVLGRTIRRVKDPLQANARGAAFIASVALNYITFDDIPDLVQFEKTFTPDKSNRAVYDKLFKEFVNIYKSNRRIYRRLNS
jgi:xylulokinase